MMRPSFLGWYLRIRTVTSLSKMLTVLLSSVCTEPQIWFCCAEAPAGVSPRASAAMTKATNTVVPRAIHLVVFIVFLGPLVSRPALRPEDEHQGFSSFAIFHLK